MGEQQDPTVGRIVHYHGGNNTPNEPTLAAIVTHVHSPSMVNLAVFDSNGNTYGRTSVQFLAEDPGTGAMWAEWPPRV